MTEAGTPAARTRIASPLLPAALLALAACASAPALQGDSLAQAIAAPHRSPANVARDPYRHPREVIEFFGIRADSVVVEILPGSAGYYMEILAPLLQGKGRYVAASRDAAAAPQYLADHAKLLARLQAEPQLYGKVAVTQRIGNFFAPGPQERAVRTLVGAVAARFVPNGVGLPLRGPHASGLMANTAPLWRASAS